MKKYIVVVFSLTVFTGYSQKIKEADLPSAVKDAFSKKYPGLKAQWQKEDGNYEAEYEGKKILVGMESGKSTRQEIEGSVLFGPDGSVLETEEQIGLTELPKGVEDHVSKNFGKKVSEAFKITDKAGIVTYETEVGKDEYLFDASGAFLKKLDKKKDN